MIIVIDDDGDDADDEADDDVDDDSKINVKK